MRTIIISLVCTLPILLICIFALATAFRRPWRHPILQAAASFRRPHWNALLISFCIIAVGFVGVLISGLLDEFLPHTDPKFGPGFIPGMLSLAVIAFGMLCSWLSGIWCLWRLLSALLSYVHSRHSKPAA